MARPFLRAVLLTLLLALFAPAVGSAAVEPEDPEELYEQGLRQMKRGYYDEALLSFQKVRTQFPFNKYSVLSELREADCLFEKAAYLEAVDSYRQFTRLHPRHPEIDYAIYRTGRAQLKLAPTVPQRDQAHTRLGLRHLQDFETRFPESDYLDEVARLRGRANRRLARAATQIANFYWQRKEWNAAERRYRSSATEFPDAPTAGRAQVRLGLSLAYLGRVDEARQVLAVAAEREDRWGKRAQAALEGDDLQDRAERGERRRAVKERQRQARERRRAK